MNKLQSIYDAKMKCSQCDWQGTVIECGANDDFGDGSLSCPQCGAKAEEAKNPIGTVSAAHVEDPESLNSIRFGYITGTGLLGELIQAALLLAKISETFGYRGDYEEYALEITDQLQDARISLYQAAKKIQNTAIEMSK